MDHPVNSETEMMLLVDECPSTEPLKLLESVPTPEGPRSKVVLCSLDGPVMDYANDTRNGRGYEELLCDMIHDSEYVAELISTGNFLGEPDHPMRVENRLDIHYPYVSHAIRNFRKVPEKHCYYATFDILDTPQGRILKTLIDYGVSLGVSSRGSGRTITKNGRVVVDPRTYRFITFDIVHMPGNKVARLPQSSEATGSSITRTLTEQVEDLVASKDIDHLQSVLPVLNFLSESQDMSNLIQLVESTIDSINESNTIAEPDTSDLVEAYGIIKGLRADLASRDSMIKSLNEDLNTSKAKVAELQDTNSELSESLSKSRDLARTHLSREKNARLANQQMKAKLESAIDENLQLRESLEAKDSEISKLNENLSISGASSMTELDRLSRLNASQESDLESMTEQLHYTEARADEATNRYFKLRCSQLGLKPDLVLKSLGSDLSGFSLDEIDARLQESFLRSSSAPKQNYSLLESLNQQIRVTVPKTDSDPEPDSSDSASEITRICKSVRNF